MNTKFGKILNTNSNEKVAGVSTANPPPYHQPQYQPKKVAKEYFSVVKN